MKKEIFCERGPWIPICPTDLDRLWPKLYLFHQKVFFNFGPRQIHLGLELPPCQGLILHTYLLDLLPRAA
jgi:hypothetical protein